MIVSGALLYLGALFLIAWLGDRHTRMQLFGQRASRIARRGAKGRPAIYALSLAVYCTSWTFYGSVGLATTTGLGFIPVYLGPILLFTIGWPLIIRIVRLAKSQNTTSIADFMAARYGKSQTLAALVAVVALLGVLPYLALQLKAVALSLETLIGYNAFTTPIGPGLVPGDIAFSVAVLMAVFAVLFGTRHIDATEHQEGLMVAIAAESIVKIVAFLVVGAFVTWGIFGGLGDLAARAKSAPQIDALFDRPVPWANWMATTVLSFCCILLLPRQFHVAVVENTSELEVRRAAWMFPLYLVLINLFVVPIAVAGMLTFPGTGVPADSYVLGLPLSQGAVLTAMVAFIGGLSAATAMVIVESVALAIMICNGLILPLILHRRIAAGATSSSNASAGQQGIDERDMGPLLIRIRRIVIFVVLGLAYLFYRTLGQSAALASIGLLSFAAIAQLAPAFFGGLFWRRATARGAIAGISVGFLVWAYTMLLPWAIKAGWGPETFLTAGPLGLRFLRPEALLGIQGDTHALGVMWSLLTNTVAYVGFSLSRAPEPIERVQANIFILDDLPRARAPAFRLWRSSVTVGDVAQTVGRYLGPDRTQRSFEEFAAANNLELHAHAEADSEVLRHAELLLASAIGAPSSRLVLSLLLRRHSVGDQSSLRLLDDASEALQYNRDLLQSALDQVRHGLAVFDKDMRLICWNRQFRQLLELPEEFGRVGAPIDRILRFMAERGDMGPGKAEDLVQRRIQNLSTVAETLEERRTGNASRVIAVRSSPMPQGGFVTTYSDVTQRVEAAEELRRANETLERRVRDGIAEVVKVNEALAAAKQKADAANLDKTRFLAAASHDLAQPLNAARLYVSALLERGLASKEAPLARNIDASLEAVEEILGALMEISRLDSGNLVPELSNLSLNDVFEQMRLEFGPAAREKGLRLRIVATSAHVRTDRRLLRRILQNLVSNAVKYTPNGSILIGCRRRGNDVIVLVSDSGPGIPADQQSIVFKEFERLPQTAASVRGLGLGLSIVDRIGRVLDHPVTLASVPGRGSTFFVALPVAIALPLAVAAETPPPVSGLNLSHVTALCVDNEPTILAGMRALLSGWGVDVLTAADQDEAISAIRTARRAPSIILADYHLDNGNGFDVVEAVRKALGADIPAVIITADNSAETQRLVREKEYILLRKPVKAAPLRAVLAQTIQRRAAAE